MGCKVHNLLRTWAYVSADRVNVPPGLVMINGALLIRSAIGALPERFPWKVGPNFIVQNLVV
eukprot:3964132-Amphidinium_carterae.1